MHNWTENVAGGQERQPLGRIGVGHFEHMNSLVIQDQPRPSAAYPRAPTLRPCNFFTAHPQPSPLTTPCSSYSPCDFCVGAVWRRDFQRFIFLQIRDSDARTGHQHQFPLLASGFPIFDFPIFDVQNGNRRHFPFYMFRICELWGSNCHRKCLVECFG